MWGSISDFILNEVPGNSYEEKAATYAPFRLYYENLILKDYIALALYWRVKRWKLTGSHFHGIPGQVVEIPIETYADNSQPIICDTNTDPYNHFLSPEFIELPFGLPDRQGIFFAELQWQVPSSGLSPRTSGNPVSNYYGGFDENGIQLIGTHMRFSFNGNTEDTDPAIARLDVFGENTEPSGGLIKLLGEEFGFAFYTNLIDPDGARELGLQNFVAEAVEYWPYDPEDGGGPIYDTVTGAQLRAFP